MIVAVFAVIGVIAISLSKAATVIIASEAENGVQSSPATVVSDSRATGASNGKVVQFGAPAGSTAAPTNLKAFTGGDSVGVTWYPVGDPDGSGWAPHYNVIRDGVQVATTSIITNIGGLETAAQYIDKNIATGQTHTYKVQAVGSKGSLSPLSTAVSATVPSSTIPVPTITLDSSFAQNVSAADVQWMQTYGIPLIKTWYPKIANVFVLGSYTPPNSIIIAAGSKSDPYWQTTWANTWGNTITLGPNIIESNPQYMGQTLAHESTHVMQYYQNGTFNGPTPRWFTEGMADYAALEIYNGWPYNGDGLQAYLNADSYYTSGYKPAGNFMNWIQQHYSGQASYIRNANVASYNNTYNTSFLQFSDGRNTDQAWALFRGTTTPTGPTKNNASGKCMDDSNSGLANQNPIILRTCNGTNAQNITYYQIPSASSGMLIVESKCMEIANSGTIASGQLLQLADCNATQQGQAWVKQSDGTIINPQSGLCLEVNGGNTTSADGSRLGVNTCNGGAWQKWTLP